MLTTRCESSSVTIVDTFLLFECILSLICAESREREGRFAAHEADDEEETPVSSLAPRVAAILKSCEIESLRRDQEEVTLTDIRRKELQAMGSRNLQTLIRSMGLQAARKVQDMVDVIIAFDVAKRTATRTLENDTHWARIAED